MKNASQDGLASHFTAIDVELGDRVLCDDCGDDYTDSPDQGGFLFLSKAICPECAPDYEKCIAEHGEEHHIRGRCPVGKSFADWVREDLRKPAGETGTAPGQLLVDELWEQFLGQNPSLRENADPHKPDFVLGMALATAALLHYFTGPQRPVFSVVDMLGAMNRDAMEWFEQHNKGRTVQ